MVTLYDIDFVGKPMVLGKCSKEEVGIVEQMKSAQRVNFTQVPPIINWVVYNNLKSNKDGSKD